MAIKKETGEVPERPEQDVRKLSFHEKLLEVQSTLRAPKGQLNTFGKYRYRSFEDILEAVKPLLAQNRLVLSVSDEIVPIGDRYYVKATASLYDADSDATNIVTAFAREEEDKKGMDGAQITGATSSYARKYALNGLLLIDDTKDADTDEVTSLGRSPSTTTLTDQVRDVRPGGFGFTKTKSEANF